MLRREQKIRNIILFTLFSLVFIGVGYAVISSNLTFNGSMRLNKITWDVHFEDFEELYDNTVTATKTLSNNNTTLTYNVNLNKPGDIFEFTIDVVNNGNIDAMLSNIGSNGLTSAQQQVMDYSVTYLDGSTPTVKDSLKIGEVETFVISVKTKANITNAQLNATDTNLTLTFTPTYAQDDGTSSRRNDNLSSAIIKLNGGKAAIEAKGTPQARESVTTKVGMYYLMDDYGKSYFYRGLVDDNNIIFNDICWKIVRINGNGTIRVIYNGLVSNNTCNATGTSTEIGRSTFNLSGDNTYIGYMHGNASSTTYNDTHKNLYDSNIKTMIDTWYENNISNTNYTKYISDTLFCNDRTAVTGTGIGTSITNYYGPKDRYDHSNSVLTCTNKNDRFTVHDNSLGNGQLKYPTSLISIDEVHLSGTKYNSENISFYLYTSSGYWTLGASDYNDSDKSMIFGVMNNGSMAPQESNTQMGVRPVINLKQGVKITSGDGTQNNPYIIN